MGNNFIVHSSLFVVRVQPRPQVTGLSNPQINLGAKYFYLPRTYVWGSVTRAINCGAKYLVDSREFCGRGCSNFKGTK